MEASGFNGNYGDYLYVPVLEETMAYWTINSLDLNDEINDDIWRFSPAIQATFPSLQSSKGGIIGAAQGIVDGMLLPWVPDLVGRSWRDEDAVIVYGSSYADFFTRFARRGHRMSVEQYQSATNPGEFLRHFLTQVVTGDSAYYEKVAAFLTKAEVPPEHVVLTDLNRTSFVAIEGDKSEAGEKVLCDNADLFVKYVEANTEWHRQRIEWSATRVIVGLGNLATRGVCKFLLNWGWRAQVGVMQSFGSDWVRSAGPSWDRCTFIGPGSREVTVLRVPHPGVRGAHQTLDGATDLAFLLRGNNQITQRREKNSSCVSRTSSLNPASKTIRGKSNRMALDREQMWRDMFKHVKPVKAAEVLARHPNSAAFTRQITDGVSASRVVAIANAMFNPCRPSKLSRMDAVSEEDAWRILLSRIDVPYSRSGSKWDRLVAALDPIPDWAIARLQRMSIMQIGSVVQALINGPYREM
jgi:hypothetical protein